jgi:uncharacterized tellurite resistance protein B-like protein
MDRSEMFKNLMVMAAVDKKFADQEVEFLTLRSNRWGLTEQQVNDALAYASSDSAELSIPDSKEERVELMKNLILMMGADGELSVLEQRLFAGAAATMDIESDELNRMIDELLQ